MIVFEVRNLKYFNTLPENLNVISERSYLHSAYDENIINNIASLENNANIYLHGYLQSHLYFDEYFDEICNLISPDEKSLTLIKTKYLHLFESDVLNISVHYRVNWGWGVTFDTEFNYFKDAIHYLMQHINFQKYKNININIFSDDINNIKNKIDKILDFEFNYIFFENNEDYIDLWCMSLCDHHILSNSTLSWWGSYINRKSEKIVIYPNDILRLLAGTVHKTIQIEQRKYQHYKPEWIGIETNNVIKQNK